MKIGVFDSGLGGLIITKAIRKMMPEYDYVHFGDTKRVPYGNKSHEAVYEFTKEAVDYLFRREQCALVLVACNTACARALRPIQQTYLPQNFKNRRVLGVQIPTAEVASRYSRVGVLATRGTVASGTWQLEINKLNNKTAVYQSESPMLVPLIEEGELELAKPFIKKYLQKFKNRKLDALVLGCTHYPILKSTIKKALPKNIRVISQDEIIPKKLKKYLENHPGIERKLSKKSSIKIVVTDKTQNMDRLIRKWFGKLL
jgi:glutamate racemase